MRQFGRSIDNGRDPVPSGDVNSCADEVLPVLEVDEEESSRLFGYGGLDLPGRQSLRRAHRSQHCTGVADALMDIARAGRRAEHHLVGHPLRVRQAGNPPRIGLRQAGCRRQHDPARGAGTDVGRLDFGQAGDLHPNLLAQFHQIDKGTPRLHHGLEHLRSHERPPDVGIVPGRIDQLLDP